MHDSTRKRPFATEDRGTSKEPFAALPTRILERKALSPRAKLVYGALRYYARTRTICYPSRRKLADKVGCSIRSVSRALQELQAAGLIDVVDRRPRSNEYILLPLIHAAAGVAEAEADPSGEHANSVPLTVQR